MRWSTCGRASKPALAAGFGLMLAAPLTGCSPESPRPSDTGIPPANRLAALATRVNSVGMRLVHVPAGSFLMGCPRKDMPEWPVHRVQLSDFWIGQYEVTNAQFERFKKRRRPPESRSDNQPVMYVSWYEAAGFCQWISRKEGRHYRLPTEAEWEYAARGGLGQKDYPWGDESPEGRAAVAMLKTRPVGGYPPNGFGLYDVAGNIDEWVSDWYDAHYYRRSPVKDPTGPAQAPPARQRVMRGGSFGGWQPYVWLRDCGSPDWGWGIGYTGFRVALGPEAAVLARGELPAGMRRAR